MCRPGFGGRRCDQCTDNHWGNPRSQCFPCDCNPYGSEGMQCDRDTGRCPCKEGMGGDKCDQCARGFKGRAPYCDACGECFNNWDRILSELRGEPTRAHRGPDDTATDLAIRGHDHVRPGGGLHRA